MPKAQPLQPEQPAPSPYDPRLEMKGMRAGIVVLVGIAIGNVATAVFHLITARWLGPSKYADLAALLALVGIVSFPLAGAQFSVARGVAHARATGDEDEVRRVYRRYFGSTAVLGALATAVLAGAALPIASILDLDRTATVLVAAFAVLPGFVLPVIIGLVQGLQRFKLFAATQVAVPVGRTLVLLIAVVLDLGVAGALGANAAAFLAAAGIFAWYLREWLRDPGPAPAVHARAKSVLVPAVGGILAFTSLTTLDIVVAKVALPDNEAGLYGAASILGRLILFLPAAAAAVLLPRVASRSALGQETRSILLLSMGATAALALLTTLIYAVAPNLILRLAYGEDFVPATDLLWKFGLAMTLFAVVNVVFVYDIGRSRAGTAVLMAVAAVVQVAGFAAFHDSATELVLVDICVGAALAAASLIMLALRGTTGERALTVSAETEP